LSRDRAGAIGGGAARNTTGQESTMSDMDIVSAVHAWLAEKLEPLRYDLWFGPKTRLSIAAGILIVESATQFAQDWLRVHYRKQLETAFREAAGRDAEMEFRVNAELASVDAADSVSCRAQKDRCEPGARPAMPSNPRGSSHVSAARTRTPAAKLFDAAVVATKSLSVASHINGISTSQAVAAFAPAKPLVAAESIARRKFSTLDSFASNTSSQLSLAAAKMVAEKPGSLTPLVFHGPSGCGKTHLLEGIWSAARAQHRGANIVYLSAEQFTTYFLEALRGSGLPSFRRKHRGVDLLIVDDLQFFAGKRATLVEVLHTIDSLLREGKQLVFSSDRAPTELHQLGPELMTRLAGGMVCRLESPDLHLRRGLVNEFARRLSVELSQDIVELIATRVTTGAREIAGAINRIHATGRMMGKSISYELAVEALAGMHQQSARTVRLVDIERAVCGVFGLPGESLQSSQRTKNVNAPRMLAMWLARKHTRAGLNEIGQYFGRRSHSTVISANKRVTDWMTQQSELELADRRCQIDEAIRRVEDQLRVG
jgi:chromosomal replication initiator protein